MENVPALLNSKLVKNDSLRAVSENRRIEQNSAVIPIHFELLMFDLRIHYDRPAERADGLPLELDDQCGHRSVCETAFLQRASCYFYKSTGACKFWLYSFHAGPWIEYGDGPVSAKKAGNILSRALTCPNWTLSSSHCRSHGKGRSRNMLVEYTGWRR